jgi:AcrR family transcriptional regulator
MPRLAAKDWVFAAEHTLAQQGIDAVRVETLARDLGVSKGSFYWHFKDRDALLTAIQEDWEARATSEIIAQVEAAAQQPAERLRLLIERVFGATTAEQELLETALRAWGTLDRKMGVRVQRIDKRRLDYVSKLLTEAGLDKSEAARRARFLYAALVGEFLMRSHGTPALTPDALQSLHALLLHAPAPTQQKKGQRRRKVS